MLTSRDKKADQGITFGSMSLIVPKKIIEFGDPVVMFSKKGDMELIKMEEGKIFDGRHGHYPHNTLVGQEYGSKVYSKTAPGKAKGGFVYLLYPTPELWTYSLRHRTEILYNTDISMICLQLELKPGMIVLESGTGSGNLSSAIARTIAPSGHLFTFEFHAGRVEAAINDFKNNKLDHLITIEHRDVLGLGFGVENKADAIFLDLPAPWTAIPHAQKALKANKRLCSFSPCIEQVQRTCVALSEHDFHDICTIECLVRPHLVRVIDQEGAAQKKRARDGWTDTQVVSAIDPSNLFTQAEADVKGHSGFLTFARKLVL